MKKIFTLLIGIVFSSAILNSQEAPPQAFSFKATIFNKNGAIIASKAVGLQIVISKGSIDIAASVYKESYTIKTNEYGQVDVIIGKAYPSVFSSIPWSEAEFYLHVFVDVKGGTDYQPMSVTQLLSVPYALYADDSGPRGIRKGDMQYWNGNEWVLVPAGSEKQILIVIDGIPTWGFLSELCQLPTISTTSISSITPISAIGGGNVTSDGGCAVFARGVCYATTQNPTTADGKTWDGSGTGTFNSTMTGLIPNTLYYVRAYAINSSGTKYGNEVTFSTLNIVCPTVTTSTVSSITPSTAISGGNITSDGGSPITARGVCWSTSADPTVVSNKTNDGNGAGIFTSNITGLLPGITYHVRAYATNISGTCYGDEKTFTTSCELPTVTTTAVNNVTQTTAIGGGNITSDGGCGVTIRGICYGTSENPTIAGPKVENGSGTGGFTSSMTGLTPSTLYHVRAYATNSVSTAYGQDITFTTLGGSSDADNDGDGWSVNLGDCNDDNVNIYPGAVELSADGIDQDCDGRIDDNTECINISSFPYVTSNEFTNEVDQYCFKLPSISYNGQCFVSVNFSLLQWISIYIYENESLITFKKDGRELSFNVETGKDYKVILRNRPFQSTGYVFGTFNCNIIYQSFDEAGSLKINEVDYDQPGTDVNEFIELYNFSTSSVLITGWKLEFINGSDFTVYRVIDLTNYYNLPGKGFLTIDFSDMGLSQPNSIQNGPDAIVLKDASGVIMDALAYGSYLGIVGVEGTPSIEDPGEGNFSIGRNPDGVDTNNNIADFSLMVPTPGNSNHN
jgi:hypothetical protein